MAKELERLVERHVRAEYDATLVRLLDDVDFARRYHQVVLDSLQGAGKEEMRDLVAESKRALDTVLSQLDQARLTLSERADRKVEAAQLALLKELGEFLGDRINNPLAVIMASAQLLEMRQPGSATTEAAERITAAVSKINAVVREIALKSER
jgi:nitrogen-specific signal transduction histidine kinase